MRYLFIVVMLLSVTSFAQTNYAEQQRKWDLQKAQQDIETIQRKQREEAKRNDQLMKEIQRQAAAELARERAANPRPLTENDLLREAGYDVDEVKHFSNGTVQYRKSSRHVWEKVNLGNGRWTYKQRRLTDQEYQQ